MREESIGLNGRLAARWARRSVDRLRKERAEIDELNVFPVPDGDTGTNMYHTLRSAYLAVEDLTGPVTLPQVVAAVAAGAARGARGNSGLILAVALQGVADALSGVTVATSEGLAQALELASIRAREAVARPVDGTMLTVLDAMADEAREQADAGAELVELVTAVRERSREALRETTSQLDVLSEAEVVDAGSTGIVELFDLLYATVTGRTRTDSMLGEVAKTPRLTAQTSVEELEIVAVLARPVPAAELAAVLEGLGGTSIVITASRVHVHVPDEVSAVHVLESLDRFDILRLRMEDLRIHEETGETELVVLVKGLGLLMHCALNGATALVPGLPGTADALAEILAEAETDVIIVPSSTTTWKALGSLRGRRSGPGAQDRRAHVVRSRTLATLLAAVAVYDQYAPVVEIFADMTEAAVDTRLAEVVAVSIGSPRFRGFVDGKAASAGDEPSDVVLAITRPLLDAGGELLTVVYGTACPPALLAVLRTTVAEDYPQAKVQEIASHDDTVLLAVGVE